LDVVPHLQEHLFDVGELELARVVLPERVQLARGDGIGPDLVLLREERVLVGKEFARDRGR
jgi:hypothetical protein